GRREVGEGGGAPPGAGGGGKLGRFFWGVGVLSRPPPWGVRKKGQIKAVPETVNFLPLPAPPTPLP
ncbi:hypothetical protein DNR41_27625, partial [Escherichia coli]